MKKITIKLIKGELETIELKGDIAINISNGVIRYVNIGNGNVVNVARLNECKDITIYNY